MRGFITIEQLRAMVTSEDVDTVVVAFTDHYGRLQGKRYDAEFFLEGIDVEDEVTAVIDHSHEGARSLLRPIPRWTEESLPRPSARRADSAN